MPDFMAYHKSITSELYAIESRIKNLVRHNLSSGEHRESALRTLIRRHLPPNFVVGRGFVVTPNESSDQIDILVVDGNKPCLYRDGDLMIVTPDAARAIIEVKTNCSVNTQAKNNGPSQLVTDLRHLVKKGRLCDQALAGFDGFQKVWTGFFVFNDTNKPEDGIMDAIKTGHKATNHAVNCIVYHKKHFARYWTQEEIDKGFLPHADLNGPQWNYYHFDDGIAPSYFIGNLIDHISVSYTHLTLPTICSV